MDALTLPANYLYDERVDIVKEILRPLVDGGTVHCVFAPKALGPGTQVITSPNGQAKKPDNYHDWRFQIKSAPSVWFHYFEIWKLLDLGRHCSLNRAYLHIYVKRERDLDQIVCIHSDPLEVPEDPDNEHLVWQCRFKRGPHLHVSTAGDLAHCHFPLNYGHLDTVLSSIDDLTKAMADAVQIVRLEVVERFTAQAKR